MGHGRHNILYQLERAARFLWLQSYRLFRIYCCTSMFAYTENPGPVDSHQGCAITENLQILLKSLCSGLSHYDIVLGPQFRVSVLPPTCILQRSRLCPLARKATVERVGKFVTSENLMRYSFCRTETLSAITESKHSRRMRLSRNYCIPVSLTHWLLQSLGVEMLKLEQANLTSLELSKIFWKVSLFWGFV